MFYYCLFWFFIILNMFFVFKLILIIKEKKTKEHAYLFKMYSNMTWYPIIQTICCIPGTINRIYDIINTRTMFTLSVIQAVFDSFEGCFVLIVFIFSPSIKHSIKICWHKLRNRETNDGNILNSNSFTQDEQILSPNYFNDRNSDKENKFYTNF